MAGEAVYVSGFPWLEPGETRQVGINSMVSNVLCRRHNSALSGLDATAGRLFMKIRRFEQASQESAPAAGALSLFAGVDVERWILKALMGLVSSRAARTLAGSRIEWAPPRLWLRILFGEVGFPETWGLYLRGLLGHEMSIHANRVGIAPLTTGAVISGAFVWLAGLELALALDDVRGPSTGAIKADSIRRPCELVLEDLPSGMRHSLCFAWTNKVAGEAITIGFRGSGDLERPTL